jgi:hypothetical protein
MSDEWIRSTNSAMSNGQTTGEQDCVRGAAGVTREQCGSVHDSQIDTPIVSHTVGMHSERYRPRKIATLPALRDGERFALRCSGGRACDRRSSADVRFQRARKVPSEAARRMELQLCGRAGR